MTNKYDDHLQVLPEDDANRQLVVGFRQCPIVVDRRIQTLHVAGGWRHVLGSLEDSSVTRDLENYPKRHLLLMIDFDGQVDDRQRQFQNLRAKLPQSAQGRVYLIGSRDNPETLRAVCGMTWERIGQKLADDCPTQPTGGLWQHQHLQHNAAELARLAAQVKPFLFT